MIFGNGKGRKVGQRIMFALLLQKPLKISIIKVMYGIIDGNKKDYKTVRKTAK